MTVAFVQQMRQFLARWWEVKAAIDASGDYGEALATRSDMLPYTLINDTGSVLYFTTDLQRHQHVRTQGAVSLPAVDYERDFQANDRMTKVDPSGRASFEFPTKTLFTNVSDEGAAHQLIVRVHGWSEISAVGVDSCGTYFRTARVDGKPPTAETNARVVIVVTVDADGRKVVTVRSSLLFVNALTDEVEVRMESRTTVGETHLMRVAAGGWSWVTVFVIVRCLSTGATTVLELLHLSTTTGRLVGAALRHVLLSQNHDEGTAGA